jgi:hypothetical protein
MQVPSGRLTHNGVLYLSLGFRQEYLLQVLTLSRHQQDLQLVLYDGLAYIGAILRPASARNPVRELDVVRVTPLLARPNEPMYCFPHAASCSDWRSSRQTRPRSWGRR